jgi:hypothetical protein
LNDGTLPVEVLFNGAFWLYPLALLPAAVVTLLKGDRTLSSPGS